MNERSQYLMPADAVSSTHKKLVKNDQKLFVWGLDGTMAKKQKAIELHVKTSTVQNSIINN
jgi:hypothetical protein